MRFALALIAALAAVTDAAEKTVTLTDISLTIDTANNSSADYTITAGVAWKGVYSTAETSSGGLKTTNTLTTTATMSSTTAFVDDAYTDSAAYLVCANAEAETTGCCQRWNF